MKVISLLPLIPALCHAFPTWGPPNGWQHQPKGGWGHQPKGGWSGGSKAAYFLRVDPSGSTVVAIELESNGLLSSTTTSTSTGGVGLQTQNYTNNDAPTTIDPLSSQQAVSVGDDYLFTVNSGSNTAVMFKIDPSDPLSLEMVGSPAPTLGEFPMSIAYSSKYQKACVLNGGAVNGVTCYSVSSTEGLVADGVGLREFGFMATTPAQLEGPKGSGSDIQFSIDSSKVITTFKGSTTPAVVGYISIFDVDDSGNVSSTWKNNQVEPLTGPFGFALSGSNSDQFFISDVAFGGGALVSLDSETNVVSLDAVVNNTNFLGSCWAVWSSETGLYYNVDTGSPNIGEINASGTLTGVINYSADLMAATDTVVVGSYLYFLSVLNIIVVIDITNGQTVQQYTYSTPSDRPYWTGLAVWPASPILTGDA